MSFGTENSIASMMNDLQVESELSLVKVIAIDDIDEIEIGGFKIEYKETDSKFDVPRWVAYILVEKNLVKLADVGIEIEVINAISKEKMLGIHKLSELKPNLYKKINFLLKNLRSKLDTDRKLSLEYDKISTSVYDLINIRINKIISLASLPFPPDDIQKLITPEEYLLFDTVRSNIHEWRKLMIGDEF